MNEKMRRGLSFFLSLIMILAQLGICDINAFASEDVTDEVTVSSNDDMAVNPVGADEESIVFREAIIHDGQYFVEKEDGTKGDSVEIINDLDTDKIPTDHYGYYKDGVLTLKNYEVNTDLISDFYCFNLNNTKDITIKLEGKNVVDYKTIPVNGSNTAFFKVGEGNLIFEGEGQLDIVNSSNKEMFSAIAVLGIDKYVCLKIKSGILNFKNIEEPLWSTGDVDISGGDINIIHNLKSTQGPDGIVQYPYADTYGIDAYGEIKISDGNISIKNMAYAFASDNYNISGGKIDISKCYTGFMFNTENKGRCIISGGQINAAIINNGIDLTKKILEISGGDISIVSSMPDKYIYSAIEVSGDYDAEKYEPVIKISGGNISVGEVGIFGSGLIARVNGLDNAQSVTAISMEGGNVNLNTKYNGIAVYDSISITGGRLESKSLEKACQGF